MIVNVISSWFATATAVSSRGNRCADIIKRSLVKERTQRQVHKCMRMFVSVCIGVCARVRVCVYFCWCVFFG